MLIEYLPIGILILLAVAFAVGSILLSSLIGPRHPTPEKLAPYECGITPVGSARDRFAVRFYLVAMLFIVFDTLAVFLFPWALILRSAGLEAFWVVAAFVGIVGLLILRFAWDVWHGT